jgi:hypothetical protein
LWKLTGLEYLINLDNRHPRWRFIRKFWEQYLNAVMRGKEIYFELEVVKAGARGHGPGAGQEATE